MEQFNRRQLTEWRNKRYALNPNCELCGRPMAASEVCADHSHSSGLVRGIIHRSCNSVLGKTESGRRYGNFDVLAFAQGLHKYLTKAPLPLLHPSAAPKKPKKRKSAKILPFKFGGIDKKVLK